jgi:hypothetical protein
LSLCDTGWRVQALGYIHIYTLLRLWGCKPLLFRVVLN